MNYLNNNQISSFFGETSQSRSGAGSVNGWVASRGDAAGSYGASMNYFSPAMFPVGRISNASLGMIYQPSYPSTYSLTYPVSAGVANPVLANPIFDVSYVAASRSFQPRVPELATVSVSASVVNNLLMNNLARLPDDSAQDCTSRRPTKRQCIQHDSEDLMAAKELLQLSTLEVSQQEIESLVADQRAQVDAAPLLVNGVRKFPDEGRFPMRSLNGGVHEWYRDKQSIRLISPTNESQRELIEAYLSASDAQRKEHKEGRMTRRLVTHEDIAKIGGKNSLLEEQEGIFAARHLKADNPVDAFLGVYEGELFLTPEDFKVRIEQTGVDRLSDYGWTLPWAERGGAKQEALITSFVAENETTPRGCMLSCINTAITDEHDYDDDLINVVAVPILTEVGQKHGLTRDSVAYVLVKDVMPGEQLFMSYGEQQLLKILGGKRVDLSTYTYESGREGEYPVKMFDSATLDIDEFKRPRKKSADVIIVQDLPNEKGEYRRYPGNKTGDIPLARIKRAATKNLNMDKKQRADFMHQLYEVDDNKVYLKKDVKKGDFLGIYGGVVVAKAQAAALANKLGLDERAVLRHSWNLQSIDSASAHFIISAAGTGNLLELVQEGRGVKVDTVRAFSWAREAPQFPLPDCMIYYAKEDMKRGECLTAIPTDQR